MLGRQADILWAVDCATFSPTPPSRYPYRWQEDLVEEAQEERIQRGQNRSEFDALQGGQALKLPSMGALHLVAHGVRDRPQRYGRAEPQRRWRSPRSMVCAMRASRYFIMIEGAASTMLRTTTIPSATSTTSGVQRDGGGGGGVGGRQRCRQPARARDGGLLRGGPRGWRTDAGGCRGARTKSRSTAGIRDVLFITRTHSTEFLAAADLDQVARHQQDRRRAAHVHQG